MPVHDPESQALLAALRANLAHMRALLAVLKAGKVG